MSDEKPKSGRGEPSPGTAPKGDDSVRLTQNNSGRVRFDDRGNAVWEWAVATGRFAAEPSTERLRKLDASLSLTEDPGAGKNHPDGLSIGYSPYDRDPIGNKPEEKPRKKDLRRLGEYYKLRRQAELNKKGEG